MTKGTHSLLSLAIFAIVISASATTFGLGVEAEWEGSSDEQLFRSGDTAAVKNRIAKDRERYEALCELALNTAVDSGHVALVQYLSTLGWLKKCGSPFLTAALNEDVEMMRYLMAQGLTPAVDILRIIAGSRKYKAVEFHLSNGVAGDALALSNAADASDMKMVKRLCEAGSDPDSMLPLEGRNTTAAKELAWKVTHVPMYEDERIALREILNYFESGRCKQAAVRKVQ